jgi:guanylate kinase
VIDYHFVSVGEFAEMIENDELLEYAVVYGDYKGIPKQHVREALASGHDVIMRIDVQGAATIRRAGAQRGDDLPDRRERGGAGANGCGNCARPRRPDQLKMRIVTARRELRRIVEFDYVVVNRDDHLDDSVVTEVLSIIKAEKSRVDWTPVVL